MNSFSPGIDPWLSAIPLDLARDVMIARYITIASLTVSPCYILDFSLTTKTSVFQKIFIWESVINIGADVDILIEHRLRLPTVIYFVSR